MSRPVDPTPRGAALHILGNVADLGTLPRAEGIATAQALALLHVGDALARLAAAVERHDERRSG